MNGRAVGKNEKEEGGKRRGGGGKKSRVKARKVEGKKFSAGEKYL